MTKTDQKSKAKKVIHDDEKHLTNVQEKGTIRLCVFERNTVPSVFLSEPPMGHTNFH